jgi:hypothetical protein
LHPGFSSGPFAAKPFVAGPFVAGPFNDWRFVGRRKEDDNGEKMKRSRGKDELEDKIRRMKME